MKTKKPNGSGPPGTGTAWANCEQLRTAVARAKPSAPEEPELWTERDLLAHYPWSRALARKWRRYGGGPPFVRVPSASGSGKRASIFYRPAAVREWVLEHEMEQLPKNQRDSVAQAPIGSGRA
jgi:hypothetical protein